MSTCGWVIRAALVLAASAASAQQQAQPQVAPSGVQQSPLSQLRNGREAGNNAQILTTGIRSVPDAGYAQALPSNHALIITVSEYQKSPLPGVLTDRKLGIELAQRFGVPPQNIAELSEQQVTREGLKQAFASLNQLMMPGDKLYVYFSGHGARYFNKATGQCTESLVMQDMRVVTNAEFANMIKPLSAKADKTVKVVGTFPEDSHPPIIYPIAQTADSKDKDTPAFLKCVESPAAAKIFKEQGFTVLKKK